MNTSRALARVKRFAAEEAIPFVRTGTKTIRATLDDFTLKLLGHDFEDRVRRVSARGGPGGVDPFGLDPEWAKYAMGVAAFFHRFYFRTSVFGLENVPRGRVILVSNHSGQFPFDGIILSATLFLDADPPRLMRSMVDTRTQTLPFVAVFFSRTGQVVGIPENARRLLELGEAIVVFPEGARGISKSFADRYRLADFGLGFMRLALETNTPVVPVAVIGAEEQYFSLGSLDRVARPLGIPSFPIIPQFLLPGGQMPLPTKYRVYFGEPMQFEGDPDDDDSIIEDKVLRVRATVQSMVNRGLAARKSIFW